MRLTGRWTKPCHLAAWAIPSGTSASLVVLAVAEVPGLALDHEGQRLALPFAPGTELASGPVPWKSSRPVALYPPGLLATLDTHRAVGAKEMRHRFPDWRIWQAGIEVRRSRWPRRT